MNGGVLIRSGGVGKNGKSNKRGDDVHLAPESTVKTPPIHRGKNSRT